MVRKLEIFILFLHILRCNSQEIDDYLNCERNDRCDFCMMENIKCNWCSNNNFHLSFSKFAACNSRERLIMLGCPEKDIIKMKDSKFEIIENEPFTDIINDDSVNAIQIKPQRISLTLSPFETQSFTFQYRPTLDYPLNLYFLMDLTDSMVDDKDTIVRLSKGITETLTGLTKHFKLGFGSFADKNLMPYSSMQEKRQENPCHVINGVCEKLYDFKHSLSFTQGTLENFVNVVNNSKNTANVDNAEGGMDALMQVLVCDDKIGWDSKARKMILFVTDGLSHFAGDGILGGVVQPNDKMCHLDDLGNYIKAEQLDYPSLEQIFRVLQEQRISVIFGVTEEFLYYYNQIKELLPENTFVGNLAIDSSNILSLVKQGYRYIVSVINFEIDGDDVIEFTMYSNCSNVNGEFVETSKCTNVEMGKTYDFRVEMKIKDAEKRNIQNMKRKIFIKESQLGRDQLAIDIKLTTDCECSKDDNINCPENAEFSCGKCICKPGWIGDDCTCNEKENVFSPTESKCSAPGDPIHCSGNGDCICNQCKCDQGWTGTFCECPECPKDEIYGVECGGIYQGRCECGKCICREGRLGPACSYSDSTCFPPWNKLICSGNGICEFGKCQCMQKQYKNYTGQYCEICLNCENPTCDLFEQCVKLELKIDTEDKNACISPDSTIYIPKIVNEEYESSDKIGTCILRITNETSKNFGYEYLYTYEVQRDLNVLLKIYPGKVPGLLQSASGVILLSIITAILVVLVPAFVWKVCDHLRYKREYKRHLAEVSKAMEMQREDDNPLYKSPWTKYELPKDYSRKDSSEF